MDNNKKYLTNLWICVGSEYVTELEWVTNKKAEDSINEVTESLPDGIRGTIEEKDERANKTTR